MNEINSALPTTYDALGLGVQAVAAKPRDELGQDEFFKLMVTQLSHQDPLKPLDSDELLSQVAQFSTVGGINNIEKSIGALVTSMESNQALQASTLVGRDVLVPGEVVSLVPGRSVHGAMRLEESTASLRVLIKSLSGNAVRRLELGPQPAGTIEFEWDGKDDAGATVPGGSYVVSGIAGIGDSAQAVGVLLTRRVDSVSLGRNPPEIILNVEGGVSVRLDAVEQFF